MKEKRMYVVLVSALVIMISIIYNGTYSYFVSRVEGTGNQENNQSSVITEDLQNIIIKEDTNIDDGSLIPGKSSTYSFTVENPKDMKICYDLIWSEVTNTFVNKKDLKIKLEKEDGTVVVENKEFPSTNNEVLVEGLKINGNTIDKYILTVTYENTNEDQSADMGKSYGGTIIGRIGQCPVYKETLLNGTDPVIKDELIPVTIDSDGTVKKADTGSKWYSYENKEWANAIILKDESTANNYVDGSIIPEDAIESYFVWIPKYRYQLWDLGQYETLTAIDESKVHEIPIIFGDYNTSDSVDGECATPMESGATGNCQVGDYMTHPAFLSIPSTGFWVGKFETGTTLTSNYNVRNGEAIQIKPNVSSWRSLQVANMFYTSYDYKRNLDSHMMKNTEWGAVAYLQHSIYGSQTSVRINNNSSYITGYAANNEPTCGYTATNEECNRYCNDGSCNTAYPNSFLASTTNNITGIFDMSGGAWEYVMGVLLDQNGSPLSGRNSINNSKFNGFFGCPTCDNDTSGLTSLTDGYNFPASKYYDTYTYATADKQYQRRILGDATGEMGPFNTVQYLTQTRQISSWYADGAWFVLFSYPWLMRGRGYYDGLDTGLFAFGSTNGNTYNTGGFRVVLTPQ